MNYYKKLSARHLTESSDLAEQLICLRSDMEKQGMELLKCKSSYMTKTLESPLLVRTLSQESEDIPQPLKSRPRPTMFFPSRNDATFRSADLERVKKNSSVIIKLDPPKAPYNFAFRPHGKGNRKEVV